MRLTQTRAQRSASRKAIGQSSTGIFGIIQLFNRFQLAFTLLALALSVILLFVGTYVYFDASLQQQTGNGVGQSSDLQAEHNQLFENILQFYGINESDFSMLYPDHGTTNDHSSSLAGNSLAVNFNDNFKLNNYKIGISMMFVSVISILIEVGIVCSILFEHFRLSVVYNLLLTIGLIYGLCQSQAHYYVLSLAFQILFLVVFIVFALGIKVKWLAANRILTNGRPKTDIELQNDQYHNSSKLIQS